MKFNPRPTWIALLLIAAPAILAACEGSEGGSEDDLPVIFVPGITGSVLWSEDAFREIWPPGGVEADVQLHRLGEDFERLSLNPRTGPHDPLIATDIVREWGSAPIYSPFIEFLTGMGGYVEYNVNENPARRTSGGCDTEQSPTPSLFVFAYDWRFAIEDNAALLDAYVDCVAKFHPGKKVNIVTHSMGGLVARRYVLDHPGRVGKMVTVAAPWLGSAKPLFQMIYGKISTDTTFEQLLLEGLFTEQVQDMLAYYPGLHELMASRMYYALGGPPYTVVETLSGALSNLGLPETREVDYVDLMGRGGVIDQLFPNPSYNGKTPAQSNRDFHSYSANGNSQDDWSNDTTGVQYYHLIGVQKSNDTAHAIQEAQGFTAVQIRDYALDQPGPGDATVPRLSAERKGNRVDLNAPNAKLFVFSEGDDELLEHTGLMTNRSVMERVLASLREQEEPVEEGLVVEIHAMTPHRTVIEGRVLPEHTYITGELVNNTSSEVMVNSLVLNMSDGSRSERAILLKDLLEPGESTPFEAAYNGPAADAERLFEGELTTDERSPHGSDARRNTDLIVSSLIVTEAQTSSVHSVRATLSNDSGNTIKVRANLVVWDDGNVISVRPGLIGFGKELAPGESVDVGFEVRSTLPVGDLGVVAVSTCSDC